MTKLEKAIKIRRYIKNTHYDKFLKPKELIKYLGFENEMSLQAFKRLFKNVYIYNDLNISYCMEIKIIELLNSEIRFNKYLSSREILEFFNLLGRKDGRQIRRYIQDIKDAGIKVKVKKGGWTPGYMLEERVDI